MLAAKRAEAVCWLAVLGGLGRRVFLVVETGLSQAQGTLARLGDSVALRYSPSAQGRHRANVHLNPAVRQQLAVQPGQLRWRHAVKLHEPVLPRLTLQRAKPAVVAEGLSQGFDLAQALHFLKHAAILPRPAGR